MCPLTWASFRLAAVVALVREGRRRAVSGRFYDPRVIVAGAELGRRAPKFGYDTSRREPQSAALIS